MTTTELSLPETNHEGLIAVEKANAIVIASREEYVAADRFCASLKDLEKRVDAAYDEHIAAAFKTHRGLVAKKNTFSQPILDARKIIKTKLVAWQEIEEENRRTAEAILRADEKKRAEDAVLAWAQEAQKEGQHEKAEAIINAPVEVPAIVLPKDLPKTSTMIQTRWDFRVIDLALIPREFLMLDTVKVGQVVRAMKKETNIPGIEAYSKKI